MRTLFRSFSEIKGFDGWMIGKISIFRNEGKEAEATASVVKQKKSIAILEAAEGEIGIRMMVVQPQNIPQAGSREREFSLPDGSMPQDSRIFQREEILAFAGEVLDHNWIHQTQCPIVPGLLMVEWMWNMNGASLLGSIMTFRAPAYAQEEIIIYRDSAEQNYYAVTERQGTLHLLWEIKHLEIEKE